MLAVRVPEKVADWATNEVKVVVPVTLRVEERVREAAATAPPTIVIAVFLFNVVVAAEVTPKGYSVPEVSSVVVALEAVPEKVVA